MVRHEVNPGWTITKEWEGYSINAEIAFKGIQPEEYASIFFSGGRAPEYIREDEDLLWITRWFWDNKRHMASVCHGVEIPARAGIVKGLHLSRRWPFRWTVDRDAQCGVRKEYSDELIT